MPISGPVTEPLVPTPVRPIPILDVDQPTRGDRRTVPLLEIPARIEPDLLDPSPLGKVDRLDTHDERPPLHGDTSPDGVDARIGFAPSRGHGQFQLELVPDVESSMHRGHARSNRLACW
jgi:hypothetical protein